MSLYESLAPLYDELFPIDRRAPVFLDSLSPRNRAAGPQALDAGCATGGHALALAALGWRTFGIDSETTMISLAREAARSRGLAERATFVVGDIATMEGLVDDRSFDLALCLGNTLPHLARPEAAAREAGVAAFLERTIALLEPGGFLVLQMMNYAKPGLGPGYLFPELLAHGAVMKRSYSPAASDSSSLRFVVELTREGQTQISETRLAPLAPGRVESLLRGAGFRAPAFYSGWDGASFDERRDSFFIAVAGR